MVVTGSSAKKSVCARTGAAGLGGTAGGNPVIDFMEWLEEGGDMFDMVATVALGGGSEGRGGPELDAMLLLRGGGGGVGFVAGTVARGAARLRVVTISSGRS